MNDAIRLAKSVKPVARVRLSEGGELELRRAKMAKERAGGQELPSSKFMPNVPRQVRSDGGDVTPDIQNPMSVFPKPQRMFPEDDRPAGGQYLSMPDKQDMTGHKSAAASIGIGSGGKPYFTASRDAVDETGTSGKGNAIAKTNLFKQKAGWRWQDAPEGHENTNTIVSVEHRGKHYYALNAHFPKGVDLARYENLPSEPRLRPTTRGNIDLGPQVGSILVRGKEHPVYHHVIVKADGGGVLGLAKSVKPVEQVRLASGGTPPVTIGSILQRGQPMQPTTAPPTPQEVAAARADTRVGSNIVNQRLSTIVPEADRVVGGTYTAGAPNGGRWADSPKQFLDSPGVGFKITPQIRQADSAHKLALANLKADPDSKFHQAYANSTAQALAEAHKGGNEVLQNLWEQSVGESSQAAKNAVTEHDVKPHFGSQDWDKSMSLPFRDHLWYELSGEKMAENMPELTPEEYLKGMDLVGATSARAEPGENLERGLGVLSQHLRGVPADVDLTIPSTVRQALSRSHSGGSSALPGNKTGHFSDTLALTGGVPTRFPISVNDVWVGKMFGVPDDVMSSNQSLHEPMALYFNKIRDLYNNVHGHELPFQYQSWNFQAPAWVHLRNEPSGDAYHQVWGGLIKKLQNAGVPGIEGDKITREAFMHPKFADALRRTTPGFRAAPKSTVEFGTTQTPVGAQAAELYRHAVSNDDQISQDQYLKGLTTAMFHSSRGKHPWDMLKKAITGDLSGNSDITRITAPTSESPFDAGGTFEGAVSPNIRVPLKNMDDEQIAMMHAIVGKHLKQDAMATSAIHMADPNQNPQNGYIRGHSLFVPTTDTIEPQHIRKLAQKLSDIGHDMSFMRHPNGYMFDTNPRFDDDGAHGIDHNKLRQAADQSLGNSYPTGKIMAHDYKSVYNTASEYTDLKKQLLKRIRNEFIDQSVASGLSQSDARKILNGPQGSNALTGGGKKAWNTYKQRLTYLTASEEGFKDLASRVKDSHSEFIDDATKRMSRSGIPFTGPLRTPLPKKKSSGGGAEGSVWHAYKEGGEVEPTLHEKLAKHQENYIPHDDPRRGESLAEFHKDAHPDLKNPDGSPKVFYHGTRALYQQSLRDYDSTPDFQEFDTKSSEMGSHFGPQEQGNDFTGSEPEQRGHMYPVHLNIKNPIRLQDNGSFSPRRVMAQLSKEIVEKSFKYLENSEPQEALQNALKEHGHDGIVYLNRREGLNDLGKRPSPENLSHLGDDAFKKVYPEAQDSYITFDPEQIKSASGNQGTFDPSKPRMNEARGGFIHPVRAISGFHIDTGKVGQPMFTGRL